MIRSIVMRFLLLVPTAVIAVTIVFFATTILPGDVAATLLGENATQEAIEQMRERLGLNQPLWLQYLSWMGGLFTGDLGTSLTSGMPIADLIMNRLPITLGLAALAVVFALLIAIPLGTAASLTAGGPVDRAISVISAVGIASPQFFVGLLLILIFALQLGWFPATGHVPILVDPGLWLWHMVLPAIAFSLPLAAELTRQLRSSLVDVFGQVYVRTARSYGYSRGRIVARHSFRNASLPVITVLGSQIVNLLGGVVVAERIFGLPGFGSFAFESVISRDMPAIQGVAVVAAVIAILINFVVDLSYLYLNPRLRKAA